MNKQQLASTIWQSANQMRSKIEANEYKDYILGFMFYKYLSDREISFLKGEKYSDEDIKKVTADDEKLVKHISENIGYFIAYEDLFSSWLSKGDDFDVSDVRDALSNFDANIEPTYKKLFENIFKTLQSGLYAPGEGSCMWDEFYTSGIMAIGWGEIGDLSTFDSKDAMKIKMRERHACCMT